MQVGVSSWCLVVLFKQGIWLETGVLLSEIGSSLDTSGLEGQLVESGVGPVGADGLTEVPNLCSNGAKAGRITFLESQTISETAARNILSHRWLSLPCVCTRNSKYRGHTFMYIETCTQDQYSVYGISHCVATLNTPNVDLSMENTGAVNKTVSSAKF